MSSNRRMFVSSALRGCVLLAFGATAHATAQVISDAPLGTSATVTPMTMLVMGKDHKLFYEAYNDASDLDADGVLDVRFKPGITYYGLFDSKLCYRHSGGTTEADLFSPIGSTSDGKCPGQWSGNFLNYVTTTRIDALRKVLYGGYRDVDTSTKTVLRRAYIPQDAHSWAKEYTSVVVDGYSISDYTPYDLPAAGRRHFFASLTNTNGVSCTTISSCAITRAPLLRVVTNSTRRVWEWASSNVPVLNNTASAHGGGGLVDRTVRVEVCTDTFNDGCKRYPDGNYKPVGVLHEFGERDAMHFGLLTGSYNKNMSGGVLRKAVSSFSDEINSDSGVFNATRPIVKSIDSLLIRDFNNTKTNSYRGGWLTSGPMTEGKFVDWGNPVGEMMYEALRYLAGKQSPTAAFSTSGSYDEQVGLGEANWNDPYVDAPWCAKASMLVLSDVNPSFDSDQVPGSPYSGMSSDLDGFDVASMLDLISADEASVNGLKFIGQNCTAATCFDGAPTAKFVSSLSLVRGLAPEEPTKQGSYTSAGVAYFGKTHDLNPVKNDQLVDSYVVALSSPLPTINFKVGGRSVSLVPFAKSVWGPAGFVISPAKAAFQPTNQIVDFYVETIANTSDQDVDADVNGGRPFAKFRINFEDVEQGADHDMDVVVEYTVLVTADAKLEVTVKPIYQSGSIRHSLGYVISGTTKDGVYLVVQDENVDVFYHLNTPPGMDPGACDVAVVPASCGRLPNLSGGVEHGTQSVRLFAPSGTSAAGFLKDPLWYAAKWGGFVDRNANGKPDLKIEWDADSDGQPDNYFLVQNPLNLAKQLRKAFDSISSSSMRGVNIEINSPELTSDSKVFQTTLDSKNWEGDVLAFALTEDGVASTPAWKASENMPSASSRDIYTWRPDEEKGVELTWDNLSIGQQALLGSEEMLSYLRGDDSNTIGKGGGYRDRKSLIGDIVNSSPLFDEHTNTLYVGANDGMLHAFDASTGEERFAYVPNLVFDKLSLLSAPAYSHKFFVDGEVQIAPPDLVPGKRILVGATGRGSRGLFALNVSSPDGFGADDVLWEFDATQVSVHGPDIGYIVGTPQITTLEDDSVVVVFGNGYASESGKSVLFIADLKTGAIISAIEADAGTGNGMSSPALWDKDMNGKTDTVYAGDLKGNVWKFNLESSSSDSWNVAFSGDPMFVARDAGGERQPITAELLLAQNPDMAVSPVYVFFGTGSYVFTTDPSSTQVQTWYGLIDGTSRISGRLGLIEREFESMGNVGANRVRVSSESVDGDMVGKRGWYLDFLEPGLDPTGERVIAQSYLVESIEPVLLVGSGIPNIGDDPCSPKQRGYLNFINAFTGGRFKDDVLDLNGDGLFNRDDQRGGSEGSSESGDEVDGQRASSIDNDVGFGGRPTGNGSQICAGGSAGIKCIEFLPKNVKTGRISWREIVRD